MRNQQAQVFAALDTLSALRQTEIEENKLSFSQIFSCVMMPKQTNREIMQMINASLQYRRIYRYVIENLSHHYSAKQIAASDVDKIFLRKTKEMAIDIKTNAEANEDSVEILVKLLKDQGREKPYVDLHCFQDDLVIPMRLKRSSESEFTAKISVHDALFDALTDINAEIFLR